MKINKKIKKLLSVFLIAAIILPCLPIVRANAATVTNFDITRAYDTNYKYNGMTFSITGENLYLDKITLIGGDNLPISIKPVFPTDAGTDPVKFVIFKLTAEQNLKGVIIDGQKYEISPDLSSMPMVTSITPKTLPVTTSDTINMIVSGMNLNCSSTAIKVTCGKQGASLTDIQEYFKSDSSAVIPGSIFKTASGNNDIYFTRNKAELIDGTPVNIKIEDTYQDAFRTVERKTISGLELTSNYTVAGKRIRLIADESLQGYDVYLAKEYSNPIYTEVYKGKDADASKVINADNKYTLDFTVPQVSLGEYYVILTGMDKPGLAEIIVPLPGQSVVYDKLIVVQSMPVLQVRSLEPDNGPYTGTPSGGALTLIKGDYLGQPGIPNLSLDNGGNITASGINVVNGGLSLELNYGEGKYNNIPVKVKVTVKRVIVGSPAKFIAGREAESYTIQSDKKSDALGVSIAENLEAASAKKTVNVNVEKITEIFRSSDNQRIAYVADEHTLQNGYTFNPGKPAVVNKIEPQKVQVVLKKGSTQDYEVANDVRIMITGTDFVVSRYTENGKDYIVAPQVEIQGLTPTPQGIGYSEKLYDAQNKVVDGTDKLQKAVGLLITIPKGSDVGSLGLITDYDRTLTVNNPIEGTRNSFIPTTKEYAIKLVVVDPGKVPVLSNVFPTKVPYDKATPVTITGYNFISGLKLYIDGRSISSTIGDNGRQISFNSLPMPEIGMKQVLIQNTEGGTAVTNLEYLKYGNPPHIDSIAPDKGASGTAVTINGGNFHLPDPQGNALEALDVLIGSKVMLGERNKVESDLNYFYYQRNEISKAIEINKNYRLTEGNLINISGSALELTKIYSYIFLHDDTRYYALDYDQSGKCVLKEDLSNNYKYRFELDNSSIKAYDMDGKSYGVTASNQSLIIDGKTYDIATVYNFKKDDDFAKLASVVKSDGKIYITIPSKEPNTYYDVTVVNPDGSYMTVTGGFKYQLGTSTPQILGKVEPARGDANGGYRAVITGSGFALNADVIIDGKSVRKAFASNQNAVVVSPDGKFIDFIMPKYGTAGRDELAAIAKELPVRVVVINPDDSASVSLEDGFTYIVPPIIPDIKDIKPLTGNAKGGISMEIIGTNFFSDPKDASKYPVVYFGSTPVRTFASLTNANDGQHILLNTPVLSAGDYQICVTNSNGGTDIFESAYKAVASSPVINTISPSTDTIMGGTDAEIIGKDFSAGESKVRFGDITNLNIDRLAANSGLIMGGKTKVELAGGLEINYEQKALDNSDGLITIALKNTDGTIAYQSTTAQVIDLSLPKYVDISQDYADKPANSSNYQRMQLLKFVDGALSNERYEGFEMIKLSIKDNRLLVERGYAPQTISQIKAATAVSVPLKVPSYYKKGFVAVHLFNSDSSEAIKEKAFEYNSPSTHPFITEITKDGKAPIALNPAILELSYKGGNIVQVKGRDFAENAMIKINSPDNIQILPKDITYDSKTNPTILTFTMPEVKETSVGTWDLVVYNEDGGYALSSNPAQSLEPFKIKIFKSEFTPLTDIKLIPDKGPSSGGQQVKIVAQGIGAAASAVYFDGKDTPIKTGEKTMNYIIVVTRGGKPGEVPVRIADAEDNPIGTAKFTYLSGPQIEKVVNPEDDNLFESTVPVDGGKQLKIVGLFFNSGARVVFAPKLTPITNEADFASASLYINGVPYKLESGYEGTDVKVAADGKYLLVTSPAGKLGEQGLIVINPDGAATEYYGDIEYTLKQPDVPLNVKAELVTRDGTDMFVRIKWTKVTGATGYSVYVKSKYKGDSNYSTAKFLGTTDSEAYVFQALEERTSYKFVVVANGDMTASQPSAESNEVGPTGTSVGIPDDDGKPLDNTRIDMVGNLVNIIVGEKDYDSQGLTIDLTSGKTAGAANVSIFMPADAVQSSSSKDISVTGKDFAISFNPQIFNVGKVRNFDKDGQGVRVSVSKANVNPGLGSKPLLSTQYEVKAEAYSGSNYEKILKTSGYYRFGLDYDYGVASLRKLKKALMLRRDGTAFVKVGESPTDELNTNIMGLSDKAGTFMVTGER